MENKRGDFQSWFCSQRIVPAVQRRYLFGIKQRAVETADMRVSVTCKVKLLGKVERLQKKGQRTSKRNEMKAVCAKG